jgi:alpha-glucosidase
VTIERNFSIDQTPVYLKAGAIVPMQPPMHYTGEKPVDPLIVNVWPLAPGSSSSYSVYEDSGVATEYQHGVFARTPIKATQTGDSLRVEIGPVEGVYPGILTMRGYKLQLPADWPPASVTVNGAPMKQADPTGKGGWSFEGNTLTTVVPVAAHSVSEKVTIEVRRNAGLTARRSELDGFAGAMTRLRTTYDSLNGMWPVAAPPDILIDAMQTGDRLGYHPERAEEELAHFHKILPQAQASVAQLSKTAKDRLDEASKRLSQDSSRPPDFEAQRQRRLDALERAQKQVVEAGK